MTYTIHTPEQTQLEVGGWNRHRANHATPMGQAPDPVPKKETPHNAAVRGFSTAITEAEKHRRKLKRKFGYDDKQIAALSFAYQKRLTSSAKHG